MEKLFFKKFSFLDFVGLWAKILDRSSQIFRRCCQNFILSVQRIVIRQNITFRTFLEIFGHWAKKLEAFRRNLPVRLPKIDYTCSRKDFGGFFKPKFLFFQYFLTLSKNWLAVRWHFSAGMSKPDSTCPKNLFEGEYFLRNFYRNIFGHERNTSSPLSTNFRQGCQSYVLRVHRIVLRNMFFLKNFPPILFFVHWEKKVRLLAIILREVYEN